MLIVLIISLAILGYMLYVREKFIIYAPFIALMEPIIGLRSRGIGGPMIMYSIIAASLLTSFWILRARKRRNNVGFRVIYMFFIYYLLHLPVANMNMYVVNDVLFTFSTFMVLHASIVYFDDWEKFRLLCRNAFLSLIILNAYFIASSIFSFGASPYEGVSYIYIGTYSVFALGGYALTVVMYPAISHTYKKLLISSVSTIVAILILMLITKRNYIVMSVFPFVIYIGSFILLIRNKSTLARVVVFVTLIIVGGVLTDNYIGERLASRRGAFENVAQQNRIQEFYLYPEVVRSETHEVAFMLFGRDYFSYGKSYRVLADAIDDTDRKWHSGAANYLYGLGLIGCFLVFGIWYRVISLYRLGFRTAKQRSTKILMVQGIMMILGVAFMGFMEFISSIQQGIVPFTYLGAIIGLIVAQSKQPQTLPDTQKAPSNMKPQLAK